MIEADDIPYVVNPLSVNTNASKKQRLILDLIYANNFSYKGNYPRGLEIIWKLRLKQLFRIKFDLTLSWRRSLSYRNQSTELQSKSIVSFLYDKDLRHETFKNSIPSCLHWPEHFTYLGFSCRKGLVTAPMLFTKLLRPLTGFWHDKGINTCVYLDDWAGNKNPYYKTFMNSHFHQNILKESGFVIKGIVNLFSRDN